MVRELLQREKERGGPSTASRVSQSILSQPLNDLDALKNFDAMLRNREDRCAEFVSIYIIDFIRNN